MLRIISSGLEGPERAALDAAIETKNEWGGMCPMGRSGQYGPIPDRYFTGDPRGGLVEGPSSRPAKTRAANASRADGSLVFRRAKTIIPDLCKSTIIHLRNQRGLYQIVDPTRSYEIKSVVKWIIQNDIQTLNVSASPRKDSDPFTASTLVFMRDVLSFTFLCREHNIQIWA